MRIEIGGLIEIKNSEEKLTREGAGG